MIKNSTLRDEMLFFYGQLKAVEMQISCDKEVSYDLINHMCDSYAGFLQILHNSEEPEKNEDNRSLGENAENLIHEMHGSLHLSKNHLADYDTWLNNHALPLARLFMKESYTLLKTISNSNNRELPVCSFTFQLHELKNKGCQEGELVTLNKSDGDIDFDLVERVKLAMS